MAPRHGNHKTPGIISLRGGIDEFNLVVPCGDRNYTKLREKAAHPGPAGTRGTGLEPDQLHQYRGLVPTTDFRGPFAEVTRVHLGNPNLPIILPGHRSMPVGLIA